jgi:hypothetical protein
LAIVVILIAEKNKALLIVVAVPSKTIVKMLFSGFKSSLNLFWYANFKARKTTPEKLKAQKKDIPSRGISFTNRGKKEKIITAMIILRCPFDIIKPFYQKPAPNNRAGYA